MTISKPRTQTNSAALVEVISTLNSRIEKTESDFVVHLQKVEDRLDQIVDLTKTVALLQQQSNQQTDLITEVRTQLRETSSKSDGSIGRIHTRLDEIQNHQRDRLELYSKEVDLKIESVKKQTDATDRELKQWLNRGWGVWVIGCLIFGAVQTGFYRWIDGIEKDRENISKQISLIPQHSQSIETLTQVAKESPNIHRKLEQMISDNEKQVEMLRQQVTSNQRK